MQADLEKHEEMWSTFEEFNKEMAQLADEEWIVFRAKSYRLEEFLQRWYDRLQGNNNSSSNDKEGDEDKKDKDKEKKRPAATAVTVRLLREIEKYKVKSS